MLSAAPGQPPADLVPVSLTRRVIPPMAEPPEDALLDAPGSAQAGSTLLCRLMEQRALQEAHRKACGRRIYTAKQSCCFTSPVHTGIIWGRSSRPLLREHIPSSGPVCPMEIGGRPD